MNFSDLGLAPGLVAAVTDKGYSTPTPIQLAAIPAVLSGRDVLAGAQTGTGKTAGFTLPMLQRLARARHGTSRPPARADPDADARARGAGRRERRALTASTCRLRSAVVFGGVRHRPADRKRCAVACDILVATPGRLLDHARAEDGDRSRKVEILVLDEADRMLDMGFIPDIKRDHRAAAEGAAEPAVLRHLLRRHPQTGAELLRNPHDIEVAPPQRDRRHSSSSRSTQSPRTHKRACWRI